MIEKKTTLILGAGASVHAGYPLGLALLKNLCDIRIKKNYPKLPESWNHDDVDSLLISLSRSGYYSIDAFLESSEKRELGKYLIANELKKHEVVDKLFPPYESGWYQILFSSLITECGKDIGKNNISIITFNYDRSFEAYLHNALQHRFQLSREEAWSKVSEIPIVHVHGILGEYPTVNYQPESDVESLLNISAKIKIIHEIKDIEGCFCNLEFAEANRLLSESERIVFLGFGFHDDNVRRFNFFSEEALENREVYSTFRNEGEVEYTRTLNRLEKFGLKPALEAATNTHCTTLFKHRLVL